MLSRLYIVMLVLPLAVIAAIGQPFVQQITPFDVERTGGLLYPNPFSGGLLSPRIGLVDADRDGWLDLFTLNPDGRLRLYRNEGNFSFHRVFPSPYDTLPVRSWFRLVDIDNDGDDDLITSGELSQVLLYRNTGTQAAPLFATISDTVRGADGSVIFSDPLTVPALVDIDADSDLDLLIGNSGDGSITFYENRGNASQPVFTFITARFQNIQVISPGTAGKKNGDEIQQSQRHGSSVQSFVDIDGDGDLDMLFGDYFTQKLLLFHNDGTPQSPAFSMSRLDTAFRPNGDEVFSQGFNQTVGGDLDHDGDVDIIVSSLYPLATAQPLILYENTGTQTAPIMRRSGLDLTGEIDVGTYAAPALVDDFTRMGMLIGSTDGTVTYFSAQNHEGVTTFQREGIFKLPAGMFQVSPTAGDLDGDGVAEVVIGTSDGYIRGFRFPSDGLVQMAWQLDTFKVNQNAAPAFIDMDGDLDLDLVVGAGNGRLVYFRNVGNRTNPIFVPQPLPDSLNTLDVGMDATPCFFDIDQDGDYDAIIGGRPQSTISDEPHRVRFYINQNGNFGRTPQYPDITIAQNPVPMLMALPEGRFLFIGDKAGGLMALVDSMTVAGIAPTEAAQQGEMAVVIPQTVSDGGAMLTVEWNALPDPYFVLTDQLGREIMREHLTGFAGTHRLMLPGVSSGIYFYRIGNITGRLMVLK